MTSLKCVHFIHLMQRRRIERGYYLKGNADMGTVMAQIGA
jgi:hypothetical protein